MNDMAGRLRKYAEIYRRGVIRASLTAREATEIADHITNLEEQLIITRKYSYGDGYEGASTEFAGLVQERDDRITALEAEKEEAYDTGYRDAFNANYDPLTERIAALEEAGEEMANNLAFLANHLTGRIGEGAQAEMLRLAEEWYELVPKEQGNELV